MTEPTTSFVWKQLSSALRQFIRRRAPDEHVADDLLQEAFLRIHRNLGTLNEADRLAPWVYEIARNVIHDYYRKSQSTTVALDDADVDDESDDSLSQIRCRAGDWLDELIRQLPEPYREAVQLAEIEGLPQQAVADRLGLSLSGGKSRIQRGRAMFKEILDQCCTFEFDRRGNLMDVDPKPDRTVCRGCDEDASRGSCS